LIERVPYVYDDGNTVAHNAGAARHLYDVANHLRG